MTKKTTAARWGLERPGLTMILASLTVIAVIIAGLLTYLQDARTEQIRSQGVSLARLLSGLTLAQLVPERGQQGLLNILASQASEQLAYVAVVDQTGNPLLEVSPGGTLIPPAVVSTTPSEWLSEHAIATATGRQVMEFHAPVLEAGELAASIRLGYFQPSALPSYQEIPFLAMLALPIFLLTPLFYLLLKREMRPLLTASNEIEKALTDGPFQNVEVQASGDLADFMGRFTRFMQAAEERIHELEANRGELLTSAKLLSYRKSKIENVLQSLPEAILILDENGRASYANEKIAALLGVPSEVVTSKHPREWCTHAELLEFLGAYERKLPNQFLMDTVSFKPAEHSERTLSLNGYPLFSPKDSQSIYGTLVVVRDVTEQDLARQGRAEFVAHLAHELKTPLNTLGLYSEALMDDGGRDANIVVESANVIHDEVERVSALINNLLNITRIEMGSMDVQRQRVRLKDLLQDIASNLSHEAQAKGIDIQVDLPHDITPVSVDKDLLRIAINNLLTNAIKYNQPSGRVTLSAEERDDTLRISVTDTGIGIPEDERESIFSKFYRGGSSDVAQRTGHGLGLSLARDIVEMHDGELLLESAVGQGSTFTIALRKRAGLLQQAI
jgi:PAS domain S-box-containing protein